MSKLQFIALHPNSNIANARCEFSKGSININWQLEIKKKKKKTHINVCPPSKSGSEHCDS